MTKKTRDKLKKLFSNGQMPSEVDFADLIDSSLNSCDDGLSITQQDGIQIMPTELDVFASIYARRGQINSIRWQFKIDSTGNYLTLHNAVDASGLTDLEQHDSGSQTSDLDTPILAISASERRVGVNKTSPVHEFDVQGVVASTARMGTYGSGEAPADGTWHDILTGLEGCHMLEIAAGVSGGRGYGRSALLRAVAINCYNPVHPFSWFQKRIKHQHGWYFSSWDRLKLRWARDDHECYKLQIKTVRDYTKDDKYQPIKYHITQLWLDSTPSLQDKEKGP
jgi:hypothetical protein